MGEIIKDLLIFRKMSAAVNSQPSANGPEINSNQIFTEIFTFFRDAQISLLRDPNSSEFNKAKVKINGAIKKIRIDLDRAIKSFKDKLKDLDYSQTYIKGVVKCLPALRNILEQGDSLVAPKTIETLAGNTMIDCFEGMPARDQLLGLMRRGEAQHFKCLHDNNLENSGLYLLANDISFSRAQMAEEYFKRDLLKTEQLIRAELRKILSKVGNSGASEYGLFNENDLVEFRDEINRRLEISEGDFTTLNGSVQKEERSRLEEALANLRKAIPDSGEEITFEGVRVAYAAKNLAPYAQVVSGATQISEIQKLIISLDFAMQISKLPEAKRREYSGPDREKIEGAIEKFSAEEIESSLEQVIGPLGFEIITSTREITGGIVKRLSKKVQTAKEEASSLPLQPSKSPSFGPSTISVARTDVLDNPEGVLRETQMRREAEINAKTQLIVLLSNFFDGEDDQRQIASKTTVEKVTKLRNDLTSILGGEERANTILRGNRFLFGDAGEVSRYLSLLEKTKPYWQAELDSGELSCSDLTTPAKLEQIERQGVRMKKWERIASSLKGDGFDPEICRLVLQYGLQNDGEWFRGNHAMKLTSLNANLRKRINSGDYNRYKRDLDTAIRKLTGCEGIHVKSGGEVAMSLPDGATISSVNQLISWVLEDTRPPTDTNVRIYSDRQDRDTIPQGEIDDKTKLAPVEVSRRVDALLALSEKLAKAKGRPSFDPWVSQLQELEGQISQSVGKDACAKIIKACTLAASKSGNIEVQQSANRFVAHGVASSENLCKAATVICEKAGSSELRPSQMFIIQSMPAIFDVCSGGKERERASSLLSTCVGALSKDSKAQGHIALMLSTFSRSKICWESFSEQFAVSSKEYFDELCDASISLVERETDFHERALQDMLSWIVASIRSEPDLTTRQSRLDSFSQHIKAHQLLLIPLGEQDDIVSESLVAALAE